MCVYSCVHFIYYRQHRGEVIGLAFSPDGEFMYSADSEGSLALYNASDDDHNVIRVVCMYTKNIPEVYFNKSYVTFYFKITRKCELRSTKSYCKTLIHEHYQYGEMVNYTISYSALLFD